MRVTRESLLRIASEAAQERAYNDPQIIAAYLTGSLLLSDEPLLGGTTDIDLVFVHTEAPARPRECVRLTADFHLDITRRPRETYRSPRELRSEPWLGWEMYDPRLLFEREKFFEFVQAGVRAGYEFEAPAPTLDRCRSLYVQARRLWLGLSEPSDALPPAVQLRHYLESIYASANAVAELTGPPLSERRFLLQFPERARAAGREGLHAGVLGLLGAAEIRVDKMDSWLPDWTRAFAGAGVVPDADSRLHAARQNYYEKAIKAMLGGEVPLPALWLLLHTWTLAAGVLQGDQVRPWQSACADLELAGASFAERLKGLDHFLDEVDLLLEEYAAAHGLTIPSGM